MKTRTQTNYVVIHHSGSTNSTVESITHWHVTHEAGNKWPTCGYHYIIDKVGNTTETLPINAKGIHCKGSNHNSVGVCLVGNFDVEPVSGGQLAALKLLLSDLKEEYPGVVIVPHSYLGQTACPGYNLLQLMGELK